jgi:hypothetical protein
MPTPPNPNPTNTYKKHTKVRCWAEFKDATTHALVDPADVYMGYLAPLSGANPTYHYGFDPQVVRHSQGYYYFDLLLNEVGDWYYGAKAATDYEGAFDRRICVDASHVF